jgi:cytochrome c peroxidase
MPTLVSRVAAALNDHPILRRRGRHEPRDAQLPLPRAALPSERRPLPRKPVAVVASGLAALVVLTGAAANDILRTPDPSGVLGTMTGGGGIDHTNTFFQSLGTNGRSCATCHVQANGWGLSPSTVQERFAATKGTDPLFRTNDGSNSPAADVSTVSARRAAYSMLLSKAVIRVGISVPPAPSSP